MTEGRSIRGLRVVSPSRRDPRWAQIASLGLFTVIGLGIYVVAGLATALSKELIRARGRHVFNPSNLGLVSALLLFGGLAGRGLRRLQRASVPRGSRLLRHLCRLRGHHLDGRGSGESTTESSTRPYCSFVFFVDPAEAKNGPSTRAVLPGVRNFLSLRDQS